MDIRIGQGFDVHKFSENRELVLCGVKIPCEVGLLGHSDADVATHALMDALLGALALADIGTHFPDNDNSFKNIDSTLLLEKVLALPAFAPWQIGNLDVTIIAQKPKLAPYRDDMRLKLAQVCGIGIDRVSVKFTTTEKLGFTGRKEGIASMASVLICRK